MKTGKYFRANPLEVAILKAWSEKTGEKEAVFIREAIREKAERDGVHAAGMAGERDEGR